MATPATFELEHQIIYCHYDGHPTGAAERLARMIGAHTQPGDQSSAARLLADTRGGIPFAFIRANLDAEQPRGNTRYGYDAHYHYAIETDAEGRLVIAVEMRTRRRTWQILDRDYLVRWLDRQRIALAGQLRAAGSPEPDERAGEIIPVVVEAELPTFAGRSTHCCATLPVATHLADTDTDAAVPWRRALQAQADRYAGTVIINPSPNGGLT